MFLSFQYRRYVASNIVPWLTLVYAGVVLYASLHPLSALRFDSNISWAFLSHRWNWIDLNVFDNLSNIVAYMPLGFGLSWLMLGSHTSQRFNRSQQLLPLTQHWRKTGRAVCWQAAIILSATVLSSLWSLGIEVLQSYSPQRVSSTVDIACNGLGACLGAGLAEWFKGRQSWLMQHLQRAFAPHSGALFAVLGLWVLAQINPQGWAFMTAPLAQLAYTFLPPQAQGFAVVLNANQLRNLEHITCIVAIMNMLSLLRLALHPALPAWHKLAYLWFALLIIVGWQTLVYALQLGQAGWDALFSAVVVESLSIIAGLAVVWVLLPSAAVWVLAVLLLAVHIALAQMLPAHPYASSSELWQQARLTHLLGLGNLISALWPILALLAVMLQAKSAAYRQ